MKKKILLVDDSALMRRVMSDIINRDPQMEVVDVARDGDEAATLIKNGKVYDCILLDINMPKMNGIGFLKFMDDYNCKIPTLIVSNIASLNTKETIQALELGAFDFVKKPSRIADDDGDEFHTQLISKLHSAAHLVSTKGEGFSVNDHDKKIKEPHIHGYKPAPVTAGDLIVIASSTGGPKSLQTVIPKFPANIGCPIVVIQHMPAGFTASLANRLNDLSPCKVVETEDGMLLENNTVYLAKGGFQVTVSQEKSGKHHLNVRKDPPKNGLRPCADIFIESLLFSGYKNFLCAVLTGMGSDATEGLHNLKTMKNVYIVGQSEATCVVYGMPRSVAEAGIVDTVQDLDKVADALIKKHLK